MKAKPDPESRGGPVPTSSRGFLKVSGDEAQSLSSSQRVALIRRGNEFFNKGDYTTAKRIFMTVGYSDGLIRLGNRFSEEGNPLEAFRMFWLAGDTRRVSELSENMAKVIRKWLQEDEPLPHRKKRE